jgi:hypothetical protein
MVVGIRIIEERAEPSIHATPCLTWVLVWPRIKQKL